MNLSAPKHFAWMLAGAGLGLIAAFWQMMEKITLLKNKDAVLSCNINSKFSCSNVLNSHQASVFGPPNALIGIIMFSFFFTIALVGLTGSRLNKKLIYAVEAFALFMLGFTLWFLYQSVFNILSVCIFCIFIGTGVLIINAVMLRQTVAAAKFVKAYNIIRSGADVFVWSLVWLGVALTMWLKFN